MSEEEYKQKIRFISKLGMSLNECGATSHRIERHLTNVAVLLGVNGTFLIAPTSFTFCYWLHDPTDQRIQVVRTHSSGGDLGKLEQVDSLIEQFGAGELSFDQITSGLDEINACARYYSKATEAFSWMIVSACFSSLLSSNLADAIVSGVVALLIHVIVYIIEKSNRLENLIEVFAAFVSGIIVTSIAALGVSVNIPFVILSTVIAFVPGLALTVALNEIAQKDLISGTSKLVDAIMAMLKLYFGAVIGVGLITHLTSASLSTPIISDGNIPSWWVYPAITLLAVGILIAFNIRPKLLIWCLISSYLAYFTTQLTAPHFGLTIAMMIGAFVVASYANLFANFKNKPASIVLMSGLILLVPGSKTYMILNVWMTGQPMIKDTPNGTQAFLFFLALVGGLLFASVVVPTKKSL